MDKVKRNQNEEFDFEKLPAGDYYFSGEEGFVKVKVDTHGKQSWNLDNWFASLDPDKNELQRQRIIQDIKRRLNTDTGLINPKKKGGKRNFLNFF